MKTADIAPNTQAIDKDKDKDKYRDNRRSYENFESCLGHTGNWPSGKSASSCAGDAHTQGLQG